MKAPLNTIAYKSFEILEERVYEAERAFLRSLGFFQKSEKSGKTSKSRWIVPVWTQENSKYSFGKALDISHEDAIILGKEYASQTDE